MHPPTLPALQLLDAAMDGFNTTVMAYGQTGSGKTFTMSGGRALRGRFMDQPGRCCSATATDPRLRCALLCSARGPLLHHLMEPA